MDDWWDGLAMELQQAWVGFFEQPGMTDEMVKSVPTERLGFGGWIIPFAYSWNEYPLRRDQMISQEFEEFLDNKAGEVPHG